MADFGYFKFLSQNVSGETETKRGNVRMDNVKAAVLIGVQYGIYRKYSRTCHTNFKETTL
jgi:hypothetical protein